MQLEPFVVHEESTKLQLISKNGAKTENSFLKNFCYGNTIAHLQEFFEGKVDNVLEKALQEL
jgi:hypothetical protein